MKKIFLAFMVIISIIFCGCNKEDTDLEINNNQGQSDSESSNIDYLDLDFDTVKSIYGPADMELDKVLLSYENEQIYNYSCDKKYFFNDYGSFEAIIYNIYCTSQNSKQSYENIREQLVDEYGDDYTETLGGTSYIEKSKGIDAMTDFIAWEKTIPGVVVSLQLTYGDVEEDSLTFIISKDNKS